MVSTRAVAACPRPATPRPACRPLERLPPPLRRCHPSRTANRTWGPRSGPAPAPARRIRYLLQFFGVLALLLELLLPGLGVHRRRPPRVTHTDAAGGLGRSKIRACNLDQALGLQRGPTVILFFFFFLLCVEFLPRGNFPSSSCCLWRKRAFCTRASGVAGASVAACRASSSPSRQAILLRKKKKARKKKKERKNNCHFLSLFPSSSLFLFFLLMHGMARARPAHHLPHALFFVSRLVVFGAVHQHSCVRACRSASAATKVNEQVN